MTSLPTTSAAAVTRNVSIPTLSKRAVKVLTAEDNVETLEEVLQDRDIASEEDEGDDRGKRNGSNTGVLPAEEVVEEGVIVGQRLASGCGLVGHLARVEQVVVLLRSLLALNSGLFGGGAVGNVLVSSTGVCRDCKLEPWVAHIRVVTARRSESA